MDTILIVDDDEFNREGLRLYLERKGYFIHESDTVEGALFIAKSHVINFAIVDIVIPYTAQEPPRAYRNKQHGVTLAKQLREIIPMLPLVLFSAYADYRGDVINLLANDNMHGLAYKLKGCTPNALFTTLKQVQRGHVIIDPEVTNRNHLYEQIWQLLSSQEQMYVSYAIEAFPSLTPREDEVARLVATSQTQKSIAQILGVQEGAIESYTNVLYQKLGLNRLAKEAGLRSHTILAKVVLLIDLQL